MDNTPIIGAEFDALPPVTSPKRVQVDGVLAVAFHNAGTVDAIINKFWTVRAGANTVLGVQTQGVAIFTQLSVEFVAGAGTQRLEIATLRLTGRKYSNL